MKPAVLLVSFSLPLFTIGCSVPKYQPTTASYQSGYCSGRDSRGFDLLRGSSPRSREECASELVSSTVLESCSQAYGVAAGAARGAGQLQKAITYGEKALEMAEKSKNPGSLFRAISTLVLTYRQVRNFDKATELVERGVVVAKGLPPNTDPRAFWEGRLYGHLGTDLVRATRI